MPIYDITVTINDTVPIYKGDPSVEFHDLQGDRARRFG
jgi:kynurenine formamidase